MLIAQILRISKRRLMVPPPTHITVWFRVSSCFHSTFHSTMLGANPFGIPSRPAPRLISSIQRYPSIWILGWKAGRRALPMLLVSLAGALSLPQRGREGDWRRPGSDVGGVECSRCTLEAGMAASPQARIARSTCCSSPKLKPEFCTHFGQLRFSPAPVPP